MNAILSEARRIQPLKMFNVTLFGETRICTEIELLSIRQEIDRSLFTDEVPVRRMILCAVATHFKISLEDMMSRKRPERLSFPRQVSMALFRDMTEDSLESIGQQFGRDHGTILYACRKVHGRADVDERFRKDLEAIKTSVRHMVEELTKGNQTQ